MRTPPTYRHLSVGAAWPSFELARLETGAGGELRLARLPDLIDPLGEPIPPVPGLEGPAGVGVDADGNVYLADPARHRILRVDICDGTVALLPCLRGPGSGPGELRDPRGVVVGPYDRLYIADCGNARVQIVDLATQQLVGILGGPAAPGAPAEPGHFHRPWDLAVDRDGRIYVSDPGEPTAAGGWRYGRVQRFRRDGSVDRAFGAVIAAQDPHPAAPGGVTLGRFASDEPADDRLLVLDIEPARLLVFRLDGTVDAAATARWAQVIGLAGTTGALAAGDDRIYVAGTGGRVLAFGVDGRFLGHAPAAHAAAAGLGIDCEGRLVAHPGAGGTVRRAGDVPAFAPCGSFLTGPFDGGRPDTRWQRIRLALDSLPDGAHVRVFTRTSDAPDRPTAIPDCEAVATSSGSPPGGHAARPESPTAPAPKDEWRAAPWDAADLYVHNEPARYLWIAGILQGDGRSSPVIRQARLDHDRDGWIAFLPGLYRRDDRSRAFLERALTLFETLHEDAERLIDALPCLFDPWAAPDPAPPWLDWLAGWLDAPLAEDWDAEARRGFVARAFERHGRRGTPAAIRELIRLYTGAHARIIEGAALAGAWALGATRLGADTRLAAAEPEGAVLGTTAVVDGSHLVPAEAFGAPAFDDVVHCFAVEVYAADLRSEDALDRIRWVIEREKPAHTAYTLCVIESRMRVGTQARIGIDTLVGGPPRPLPWERGRRLGSDTVLPGPAADAPPAPRLGEPVRLGFTLA